MHITPSSAYSPKDPVNLVLKKEASCSLSPKTIAVGLIGCALLGAYFLLNQTSPPSLLPTLLPALPNASQQSLCGNSSLSLYGNSSLSSMSPFGELEKTNYSTSLLNQISPLSLLPALLPALPKASQQSLCGDTCPSSMFILGKSEKNNTATSSTQPAPYSALETATPMPADSTPNNTRSPGLFNTPPNLSNASEFPIEQHIDPITQNASPSEEGKTTKTSREPEKFSLSPTTIVLATVTAAVAAIALIGLAYYYSKSPVVGLSLPHSPAGHGTLSPLTLKQLMRL